MRIPPLARTLAALAPTLAALARTLAILALLAPLAPAAPQTPGAGSPELQRANQLMGQGQFASAADAFRAILDGDDTNAAAWFGLGYCRHAQGDMEGALEGHVKAAAAPAFAPTASYNAACACARLGRVDDAFAWLAKARAAGFASWGLVATDTDLAALRGDERLAAYLPAPADSGQPFAEDVTIVHDLHGEAAGDQYGWVARAVGDADGDGVGDFASTAPFHGGKGAVYVHSGKRVPCWCASSASRASSSAGASPAPATSTATAVRTSSPARRARPRRPVRPPASCARSPGPTGMCCTSGSARRRATASARTRAASATTTATACRRS
jgi:hypothetical protein